MITHFLIVTDYPTNKTLEPDYADEWTSNITNPDKAIQAIRKRASKFHNLPIESIDAYIYSTTNN
jgi:hypothetical protein